jgi:hypothetical protein
MDGSMKNRMGTDDKDFLTVEQGASICGPQSVRSKTPIYNYTYIKFNLKHPMLPSVSITVFTLLNKLLKSKISIYAKN